MTKTILAAGVCLLTAIAAPAMGNTDRLTNAQARAEAIAGKVIPVLKLAAGSDPKAAAALRILEGIGGHSGAPAAAGFPGATTNVIERLPDGTERLITNEVFSLVIPRPVATPIANVATGTPVLTNVPPATVSNAIPAVTGSDLLP